MLKVKSENGLVEMQLDGSSSTVMADFTMIFKSLVDVFVDHGEDRDFVIKTLAGGLSIAAGYSQFSDKEA